MRGGCSDRSAGECKTPDETSSSRHADIYTSRLQHSHSRCSPSKRGSEREGESVRLGRVMRRRRSENGKKGSGNPETKRARVRATGVRVTGSSSRRTVACNGSKSCSDRREGSQTGPTSLPPFAQATSVVVWRRNGTRGSIRSRGIPVISRASVQQHTLPRLP